ncbi:Uncharacterised protein [Staphylococcus saprophyticus]|nr:Uncharacterised protein [Staphylococcus saprophyticus]
MMKEYVGECNICHKTIYCLNGFLNGVYQHNHLYCFYCYRTIENEVKKEK